MLKAALQDSGFQAVGLDDGFASSVPPGPRSLQMLAESDLVVLLLGHTLGDPDPSDKRGRSYTEQEFDYAINIKCPVLAFERPDIVDGKAKAFANRVRPLVTSAQLTHFESYAHAASDIINNINRELASLNLSPHRESGRGGALRTPPDTTGGHSIGPEGRRGSKIGGVAAVALLVVGSGIWGVKWLVDGEAATSTSAATTSSFAPSSTTPATTVGVTSAVPVTVSLTAAPPAPSTTAITVAPLGLGSIVFTRGLGSGREIVRLDLASKEIERVVAAPASRVSRSKDGSVLAYETSTKDPSTVVVLAGKEDRPEIRDGHPSSPAVSPDGKQIAFVADGAQSRDIFVKDLGSPEPPKLVISGPSDDLDPAWSPDGKSLAFVSKRFGERFDLFVLNLQSGNDPALSTTAGDKRRPTWSPDGLHICVQEVVGNDHDLVVYDLVGGVPAQLTAGTGFDGDPTYTQSGDTIVFVSEFFGARELVSVAASGNSDRVHLAIGATEPASPAR